MRKPNFRRCVEVWAQVVLLAAAAVFAACSNRAVRDDSHDFTTNERSSLVDSCQKAVRGEPSLSSLSDDEVSGMCQCAIGELLAENTVGQVHAMDSDARMLDAALTRVVAQCPVPGRLALVVAATPASRTTPNATATAASVNAASRAAAADLAFSEVRSAQIAMLKVAEGLLRAELGGWDGSKPSVATALQDALNACPSIPPGAGDLWPTFVKQTLIIAESACRSLLSYAQSGHTQADWGTALASLRLDSSSLSASIAAWPDYSEAQLRRAIEARQ